MPTCNVMQSLISIDLGNKCNHSKAKNDAQINTKINLSDIKLVIETTDCNPIGVRTRRRSKNRWRFEVVNDLKKQKQKLDLSRQR